MNTTLPQQPAQSASSASTRSQRRERQTRLQEHLRAVKPGSRSSSPNSGAGSNSKQQAPAVTTTTTTTSMGRSTSRKSTPSAKKKAAAAVPEPVQATTATGRPKRRAAKARVALADLQSSDDEAVGTTSKSGSAETTAAAADVPDPTEEEETPLASATPTRSAVGKARSQVRQPIPLSRQPSIEDLAPITTTTTTTRNSVGRKSPAKQMQSAAAQRRKREVSGGSASGQRSSAQPSPSPYQTDPGLMQKHQFRSVLAQHGFNPEEEVLERAIQTISSSKQELTVDTFLRVLGTLDTNVSPLKRSMTTTGVPQPLSVSVSRSNALSSSNKHSGGGFSALESPLTPSSMAADGRFLPSPPLSSSPAGRSHHPGSGSYCTAGVYRQSPALATFPPPPPQSHADSLPVPPPPRPTLYAHRSISAPSLPTLESTMRSQASMPPAPLPILHEMTAPSQPQPAATTSSSAGPAGAGAGGLFATSVAGMGRVALSRRSMFGQLGSAPGPTAAMTSHVDPTPAMSFHQLSPPSRASPAPVTPATTSGLLPAFAVGAPGSTAQKTTRSRASSTSKSSASPVKGTDDARLAKLRSWLDDDEEETTEEEEGGKTGAADATLEAEASLKASAANGKLASSLSALDGVLHSLEMRAQPAEVEVTEPEPVGPPAEIRVGGKNVSILRQSQKRQLDEVTAAVEEPDSPVKMATRAATRASSSKGKGKAQHQCVCGEDADDQPRTIACAECDVAYHLACLDATSARQLPSPFVCSRCVTVSPPAPAEPALAAGQRTPELASKRVRIGTTSTPHLLSEPTFVASTPLSAPRGDAFGPLVADLALAPSPTASPVRRFASARAPVSPVHQRAQLPIPTTPRLGDALIRAPGDYSPTSPQNTRTRASRTRLVSNTGAAFFGGNGAEWLEAWDQHQFPVADSMQAQAPSSAMSSLAEDDWRMPSWSDVNMTPSRALSSATPATSSSSSVWDTPYVHASPQARRTHSQGPYMLGHHARTPSQDLMAMLDREHASEPAHHSYSQRLFGGGGPGSAGGDSAIFDAGLQHSMMPLGHPLSPLNPRRQPSSAYGHARKQSLGDGLGRAPFAYPHSPAHAHSYLPPSHMHGLASAGMKPSFSAPGGRLVDLMPSLNYVEQQQLDDLLL